MTRDSSRYKPADLLPGLVIMAAFWALAIALTLAQHQWFWLVNFGFIGTSIGVGMTL